ncbi:MAG: CvpA family protein [Spirochaetia bacterium]|nr:CvpA family protein [Spirochaetia bacterium]
MTVFDWVFVTMTGFMALKSMLNGFVDEFQKKGALFIGLALASMFTRDLYSVFAQYLEPMGKWGLAASAAAMVLAGFIVATLFLRVMRQVFDDLHLGMADHFLGFMFGTVQGAAVTLVIIYILRIQDLIDLSTVFTNSIIFEQISPALLWMIKLSASTGIGVMHE